VESINRNAASSHKRPKGFEMFLVICVIFPYPNAFAKPMKCISPWINIRKLNTYRILLNYHSKVWARQEEEG
jgi:hypothetical protein